MRGYASNFLLLKLAKSAPRRVLIRKLQSVLLATDFSPASEAAAKVALQLAKTFGTRITLLHVLEPIPTWPELFQLYEEQAKYLLDKLAQDLTSQRATAEQSPLVIGDPVGEILHQAGAIDADLILLGAPELSRFDRVTTGPRTTEVIEQSRKPVLAVRPGAPAAAFRKIHCPVDQSAAAERGLANAIRLTRAFGGELLVLTVVPTAGCFSRIAVTENQFVEHERAWRQEFDLFLQKNDFAGISWKAEVCAGVPHKLIISTAESQQADVIVMGSTGRTGLARALMGSTTRRVLGQIPCSILTVKQEHVI